MQIIDSILDLGQTINPAYPSAKTTFSLTYDGNEWTATVSVEKLYADSKGKTADEALQNLQKHLIAVNQTIFQKISGRIKRWVGIKPSISIVK